MAMIAEDVGMSLGRRILGSVVGAARKRIVPMMGEHFARQGLARPGAPGANSTERIGQTMGVLSPHQFSNTQV